MFSRKVTLALAALAPLALAAPAFAAGDAINQAPSAKPVASDGAHPVAKDKQAARKPAPTRNGMAGQHRAIDEVWTTKAAQNDKPVARTSSVGITGSGRSPATNESAKANSGAKQGTLMHGGSNVTPDSSLNPAGKP